MIAKDAGLAIKAVSINDEDQAGELAKRADTYKIDNAAIHLADTAAVAAALKQAAEQLEPISYCSPPTAAAKTLRQTGPVSGSGLPD